MDGRHFAGQQVEAYVADGSERFKKTSGRNNALDEDEDEESKRLDEFGEWLESEDR